MSKEKQEEENVINIGLTQEDASLLQRLIDIGIREIGIEGVLPCAVLMSKLNIAIEKKNADA